MADVVETADDRSAARGKGERFNIVLLIRHPDLDPATITGALSLDPFSAWKSGDPRFTPLGRPLPGKHQDSSWNHVFRYRDNSHFATEIENVLLSLTPHKALLENISRTGGTTELFLQLPGDVNIGDALSWQLLKRVAGLKIGLSIETFPDMP